MIDKALLLLRDMLKNYLVNLGDNTDVVLENIGLLETSHADNLTNNIVVTLVNLEEESALRNGKNFYTSGGQARYTNTPVHLNLYVLFTVNISGGTPPDNGYVRALTKLSHIIRFFQGQNNFSISQTFQAFPGVEDPQPDSDLLSLKISMELYTLTFEQVNHLWGSLGGRQIPYAMYKLRLIEIAERNTVREVPIIEEIEINHSKKIR